MDKIYIQKLILNGTHGLTQKERNLSQRFQLDIAMTGFSGAHNKDSIADTIDYRVARNIATEVIQNQNYLLLETIAHKIAGGILKNTPATSVTVGIQKLDIWENAVPGVSVTEEKIPPHLELLNFDIGNVVEELAAVGAVSVPILPEPRRIKLLQEARSYRYVVQPEIVGKARVKEQLSSVREFPEAGPFHKLRDDFTELLMRKLSTFSVRDVFRYPINFNELSLQKYENGSIGITPHRDGQSLVNLICVFILTGKAEFALCDDRAGSNPKLLETTPGNVILMRSRGFFNSTIQPFHLLRNVTEERIVFGLRQRGDKNVE